MQAASRCITKIPRISSTTVFIKTLKGRWGWKLYNHYARAWLFCIVVKPPSCYKYAGRPGERRVALMGCVRSAISALGLLYLTGPCSIAHRMCPPDHLLCCRAKGCSMQVHVPEQSRLSMLKQQRCSVVLAPPCKRQCNTDLQESANAGHIDSLLNHSTGCSALLAPFVVRGEAVKQQ